jgi:hypothetical protein
VGQPGQRRRVPPIRLDPLAGFARDQAWRNHHTVVITIAQMPIVTIPTRTSLIGEAQGSAFPAKPGRQLVERCRLIGDLTHEPDLAIPFTLRDPGGNRRLVHVQPNKGDTFFHGPSPVLRQGAGPSGATLVIPHIARRATPASNGLLV